MNFSSKEFILKIKNSDKEAIQALVTKYNRVLYNAALGQGLTPEQASETLQNTWIAFFENPAKFEGRSHIRTYLFGILYNKVKESWREKKKHIEQDEFSTILDNQFDEYGMWKTPPLDPEMFAEAANSLEKIEDCMNGLGHLQKMAFHLKEVVGETTEDICNILDISATNLRVLIYRAKGKLRTCLEGWFDGSH